MHTAGVVAGGEQDTTSGLADTDDIARSRSAQNAILTDDELLDAVRRADLGNQLRDLGVPVSAITADDESAALDALGDREEDGGDESLAVVGLLEDLDLLTKAGAGEKRVLAEAIGVGGGWLRGHTHVPGFWSWKGCRETVLTLMIADEERIEGGGDAGRG